MLTRVQLSGILVLSKAGVPLASIKFKESGLKVAPTLLGGIMVAIETIVNVTASNEEPKLAFRWTKPSFHQLLAKNVSILVYRDSKFIYSIITKRDATPLQRSSLKLFADQFRILYAKEIEDFERFGAQIDDLSEIIDLAFPYSSGLTPERWE